MGNGQSNQDIDLDTPLYKVEMLCAASTIASTLDAAVGSTPVIVAPSLHQMRLTLMSRRSDFLPISANTPASAIELMLRAIHELSGIDRSQWTQQMFLRHVPTLEIVHTRTSHIERGKRGNYMATSPKHTIIRLHFYEKELILQRFIELLRTNMNEQETTRLPITVHNFPGEPEVTMHINFAPNEPTVFTEVGLTSARTESKEGDQQGLLSKVSSVGSKVKSAVTTVTPLLRAQGIDVPDISSISPTTPEGLVELLSKAQPALEALSKLGVIPNL